MLPQLQREPEDWLFVQVFQAADLVSPHVLQLQLDPLDWEEESEQSVVLLVDVRTEHQVNGPLATVVKRKSVPRVLLVRLY